nr:peptidoglycan-binding domain-containing protein [uncultured Cohaesibacter sp.]
MKARIVTTILAIALWAMPAAAQTDRVVALVISVGAGGQRADDIQMQLQLMGAETLRAHDPNNAQLRSILMRFAHEAASARATFIYLDVPAVNFEGRPFILPRGAKLNRPTDLFTQAIPIQAFSRSAAQAEQGGAVVITIVPQEDLLKGLGNVEKAPEAVPGASLIVVSKEAAFGTILSAMQESAAGDEVEIGTLLRNMMNDDRITISDLPRNLIFLRLPAKTEGTAQTDLPLEISPEPKSEQSGQAKLKSPLEADNIANDPVPAASSGETLVELELLEQTLSLEVKQRVQSKLREQQFYEGLVDGIFGPQTRDAIKAFQKSCSEDQTGILTRRQLLELSS